MYVDKEIDYKDIYGSNIENLTWFVIAYFEYR